MLLAKAQPPHPTTSQHSVLNLAVLKTLLHKIKIIVQSDLVLMLKTTILQFGSEWVHQLLLGWYLSINTLTLSFLEAVASLSLVVSLRQSLTL